MYIQYYSHCYMDKKIWNDLGCHSRGKILSQIAKKIGERKDLLGEAEALTMGWNVSDCKREEITRAINYFHYYSINAYSLPWASDNANGFVLVNLPEPTALFALAALVAPALASGSAVLIHAEQQPLTALAVAELCADAGLPPGVVNVLPGALSDDMHLLRGTPRLVLQWGPSTLSWRAEHDYVANLGAPILPFVYGKAVSIIFDSCDKESALDILMKNISFNYYQVFQAHADEGECSRCSATLLLGSDAERNTLGRERGPLPCVAVLPFRRARDAVAFANKSPFGVAASVWTSCLPQALQVASELQVGTVWINDHGTVDAAVPFGSHKHGCGSIGGSQGLLQLSPSGQLRPPPPESAATGGQSAGEGERLSGACAAALAMGDAALLLPSASAPMPALELAALVANVVPPLPAGLVSALPSCRSGLLGVLGMERYLGAVWFVGDGTETWEALKVPTSGSAGDAGRRLLWRFPSTAQPLPNCLPLRHLSELWHAATRTRALWLPSDAS